MMRAKMRVTNVGTGNTGQIELALTAVSRSDGYGEDGSDENNTYAKWTPCADLSMVIQNPNLFDKFKMDQEFYVDFTPVG